MIPGAVSVSTFSGLLLPLESRITGLNFVVPKLGATGWTALIVTGQLIASILFDHFGLLGLQVKLVSVSKVIGAILLLVGSTLITRF